MSKLTVGLRYPIKCIRVGYTIKPYDDYSITITSYLGFNKWVPLLSEMCVDEPCIDARGVGLHAHIDWRFATPKQLESAVIKIPPTIRLEQAVLLGRIYPPFVYETKLMRCYRAHLPQRDFPLHAKGFAELENKQRCAILGNVCPHRGTPRMQMIDNGDGTLTCPAHGLKWSASTGQLINQSTYG